MKGGGGLEELAEELGEWTCLRNRWHFVEEGLRSLSGREDIQIREQGNVVTLKIRGEKDNSCGIT